MKLLSKTLLVALLLIAFAGFGAATVPAQRASGHPFEPDEELVLVAEFSRALLKNIDVAEFKFTSHREGPLTLKPGTNSGAPYSLKLTGEISSKGFFSKLFNLRFREWMESIVEPASFTVHRTKRIDEQGKRSRVSEAVYGDGKVTWVESDPNDPARPVRTTDASFSGQVHDVLSAIYFLRTQPLVPGETLQLTISDSGRVYKVPVRVVEKKRFKTVLGRIDALRVDPELFGPSGMLDRKGHISIWYTNDRRRIPVKARIKTEYGTFNVTLRKVIQHSPSQEDLTSTTGNRDHTAKIR